MSDIKVGDLVMVVKSTPCCGNSSVNGMVFRVTRMAVERSVCTKCFAVFTDQVRVTVENGKSGLLCRFKKIDPPAEGDSLPTRVEKPINEVA